jgi:hypothetical protein
MKSRSFNTRIQKIYLKSAAILLCLTASAKLIGLSHDTSFQNLNDSVFYFLTNRQLLLIVSALEIIVAGYVLLPTILIKKIFYRCFGWRHYSLYIVLDYSWQKNRSRANVLAICLAGVTCPTTQFAFSQTQRSYSCYCRLPTGC